MATFAERLEAARRQQFVGRSSERDLFETALTAEVLPYILMFIHGPGGVGKTTLLREFAHLADLHDAALIRLDARNIDPSPPAFLATLAQQAGLAGPERIAEGLRGLGRRVALFIDTAELLNPLEGWLQEEFLPRLPDNTLVVIAGRSQPNSRWRTDPGWQTLMKIIPLRNLSEEEGRALLVRRQVPAAQHEAVLKFTNGHPLATSLAADLLSQQPEEAFRPEDAPDMIKTLLDQFINEAPSSDHRAALEACSQVRLLNEPLLATMLELEDARPLFDWLRGLSFIDAEPLGLFPHDLARAALAADLRWRNPQLHAALHDRARRYYMNRFQESDGRAQRRVLLDYIFLHRENPVIQPFFEWQLSGAIYTDRYRPEDREAVLALVDQYEGTAAREIAAHWLAHQLDGVTILRQTSGDVQGILFMVNLVRTSAAERALDPAAEQAWSFLQRHDPPQTGENATLFRFWMGRESYQGVSPVQSRIFLNIVQFYLTAPQLVFTFLPTADPDFWEPVFAFGVIRRVPQADFEVEGRRYGVFGHDWRAVPPLRWLAIMAERELGHSPIDDDGEPVTASALSEEAFGEAVWDSLRHFTDPVALQGNPLIQHSRLFDVTANTAERVEKLRDLLQSAAAPLQEHPRQVSWYRAVHHTYFQPAATQEQAAELLDLPFSTYRRHLKAGIDYISRQLWLRESRGEI